MKTVQAIVDARGGLDALANNPIKIEVPGFMPLSIEWIGPGPDGSEMVSVMHWYLQNGDVMRDPDMVFHVGRGWWAPWSYRQDSIGLYQEARFQNDDGEILIRLKLARELNSFAKIWDKNLAEQGFGEVQA